MTEHAYSQSGVQAFAGSGTVARRSPLGGSCDGPESGLPGTKIGFFAILPGRDAALARQPAQCRLVKGSRTRRARELSALGGEGRNTPAIRCSQRDDWTNEHLTRYAGSPTNGSPLPAMAP